MAEKYMTSEPPERFKAPDGMADDVLVNPHSTKFMMLHEPSLVEVAEAIELYATLRLEDRWRELNEVSNSNRTGVIRALQIDQRRLYNISHVVVYAQLGGSCTLQKLREVQEGGLAAQQAFVAPLKPSNIAEMLALYVDRSYDSTGYRYLRQILARSTRGAEFVESLIDELLQSIGKADYTLGTPKAGFHQPRILEFLGLAAKKGWILFPHLSPSSGDSMVMALQHRDCAKRYLNPMFAPTEVATLREMTKELVTTNTTGPSAGKFLERLPLCTTFRSIRQGSTSLFERCVELAKTEGVDSTRVMGIARKGYNALIKLHAAQYPTAPAQPQLYYRRARRTLDEFSDLGEALNGYPTLSEWGLRCAQYIKSLKRTAQGVVAQRTAMIDMLTHLTSLPSPPSRPELTRRSFVNDFREDTNSLRNRLSKKYSPDVCNNKLQTIGAFFSFIEQCLQIEHLDLHESPPRFSNPVDLKFDRFYTKSRAGSHRKAIGADILAEMRKVLVENDYAWPKQQKNDWVNAVNADTNALENVWCPSAALCLFTLLSIPLRGLQARMLDSGEGDALIFDFDSGRMQPNPKQVAGPLGVDKRRREGVLQVMGSGLSAEPDLVGMWITTNKTSGEGYAIPWVSNELMAQLKYQRDWIFRYTRNPQMHCSDEAQGHRNTPDELKVHEQKFYCLFRDPAAAPRMIDSLPVSKQKLVKLWGRLCFEVETRINSRATDDFRRVKLARIGPSGDPVAIYDLHTLRVSGITDLLDRGVPLNIVAEYVAGHATYIMTIWYDKPTPSAARRAMLEAFGRTGDTEGPLPRFDEGEIERMRPFLLTNENYAGMYTGFDALTDNAGLIQVRQSGICPGTRCEEGGLDERGRSVPVPVGDRGPSCPQCRFFVTGPAFLLGQAIEGNQLILKIRNKVAALAKLREKIMDAEDAANPRQADLLRGQADIEERQLNDMLTEWWQRMRFYENSIAKLDEYRASLSEIRSGGPTDIVLLRSPGAPAISFGFSKATELELKHFLSTCTEIVPELVNESLGAHQDIELAMGRFLAINNETELTSMFFKMDEAQRLSAANLMVEVLHRASGSPIKTSDLLDGKLSIQALPELKGELSHLLSEVNDKSIKKSTARKAIPIYEDA